MQYFLIFGMPFVVVFAWLYYDRKKSVKEFPYKLYCAEILLDFLDPEVKFKEGNYQSLDTEMLYRPFSRPLERILSPGNRFPNLPGINLSQEDLFVRKSLLALNIEDVFVGSYKGGTKINEEQKSIIRECRLRIEDLKKEYENKKVPYKIANSAIETITRDITKILYC